MTLEGFDDFVKQVEKLGDSMKKQAIGGVMRKNLQPVASAIKALAPVRKQGGTINRYRKDGTISTSSQRGNLKKSIGVKVFSQRTGVNAYAGIQKKANYDGWYGMFVERGTKTIPKNPFITRAASYTVAKAQRNLGNDINEYIVKNGQRLGLDIK